MKCNSATPSKPKVMLFTASFGDGHNQVANALRFEFLSRGTEVIQIDYFRRTSPAVARLLEGAYAWLTRYTPSIYGTTYNLTSGVRFTKHLWQLASFPTRTAVLTAIAEHSPDVILQLFPNHSLAHVKERHGKKPYMAAVLTDFSVHGHWFHDNVNTYFLPHEDLLTPSLPFLSKTSETVFSGIPIGPGFRETVHASRLLLQTPYIVIATGARGVFPDLRASLLAIHRRFSDHAVYVMCGRNLRMLEMIKELSVSIPRLFAVPFVDNVAEWFSGASFAVTKSGGLTVSECLACACPMVIFKPLPGQETDNALFMQNLGAARIAFTLDEFDWVLETMQSSFVRKMMSRRCTSLARPDAAIHVVEHVLSKV